MNARELLAQAQVTRPEQTRLAEEAELLALKPVQFTPTANTADGVVGKTTNGGELTVFNGAQNFDPNLSESYQLNLSPGRATLVANSKPEPLTGQSAITNAIVATASPTADDPGQRDQLWLNINQDVTDGVRLVETWVFVAQLGAWHRISGGESATAGITFSADPPPSPVTGSPGDGDRWYDLTVQRGWTYYATDDAYYPDGSRNFEGTYPTTNPNAYIEGDRLAAEMLISGTVKRCEWQWIEEGSDWHLVSCCPDGCPTDPPATDCPSGSYIDPSNPLFCTT